VTTRISALRFGSRARFEDRWLGTITAIEITEDWEAVNVVVEGGFLIWRTSVRLPLSATTEWTDDHVTFSCTSRQAFNHEVPPLAVPSRPVAGDTPVSTPSVDLAGALVDSGDRMVREIILARGYGAHLRIPVSEVSFEGKTLRLAAQPESLPAYRSDREILDAIHRLIREDPGLTGDDKSGLHFAVEGGAVTMTGNARVPRARERAVGLAGGVLGVTSVTDAAHDDLGLETAIGLALDRAGVSRHSAVYPRSSLGVVQLYGYVPSAAAAEDAIRATGAVPGVREVISRLEVRSAAA
jgi:osmotically-inducible protein OsmY